MSKPRFVDMDRYKNGYTPSGKTDIRKTFNRARAEIATKKAAEEAEQKRIADEQAAIEAEAKAKTTPLKRRSAA